MTIGATESWSKNRSISIKVSTITPLAVASSGLLYFLAYDGQESLCGARKTHDEAYRTQGRFSLYNP